MKFLIALIFLVTCASARRMPYHCSNTNGYTSNFEATAFNTLDPNSNYPPMSFFEAGNTTTDFVGQRTFTTYVLVVEGQEPSFGSIWEFGQTNEGYILDNGVCVKVSLDYPVPSALPLGDLIGTTKIGQFPVQIFNAALVSYNTNQTYLYDPLSCSLVSSTIRNSDLTNPGFTVMNFYNFENSFTESWFDLPSECSSQSVISLPNFVAPKHTNILKKFF
ncbi:hypothetical protein PPL_10598 [Heterostelium album PN500]|uniref:Uncharacterized protein n=1 Tax=Heterostelium pallidum (strain ATCC 26659 / Pp 5 / PN500) TaxID=670386 RepID=D3BRI7_HETP5|nr:hypothetical protein PPL_10598 [Heterostelium album PN500]EFA76019.1 hypothetical protein PPL_10598 [Heterostelium album PN500]|eukprot:XP_020428153.1 hypothetical protein PPL_10598 [Heterostelium album PN500]